MSADTTKLIQENMKYAENRIKYHTDKLIRDRQRNPICWEISEEDIQSDILYTLIKCAETFEYDETKTKKPPKEAFRIYFNKAAEYAVMYLRKQAQKRYDANRKLVNDATTGDWATQYDEEMENYKILTVNNQEEDILDRILELQIMDMMDEKIEELDLVRADLTDLKLVITYPRKVKQEDVARRNHMTRDKLKTDQRRIRRLFQEDKELNRLTKERLNLL